VRRIYGVGGDPSRGDFIHSLGMSANESSLSFGLRGTLPGSIESFEKGLLEKAETLNGENLLSSDDYQNRIQQIRMSRDKTSAAFDVNLLAPSPEAKGLKEVSGYLQYFIPGPTKILTLEKKEFKEGQEWEKQGVKMLSIGKAKYDASKSEMQLEIKIDPKTFKEVKILDPQGHTVPTRVSGRSWSNNSVNVMLQSDVALPHSGSIIFELYAEYMLGKVPFKIENIDFMGKPLSK
ncbi:hypothetical protein K8I31_12285, partial [bacterium]|nr:hypothetical protein [bacterium]